MFNIGDMLKLNGTAIKQGGKSALMAWEHKKPGVNSFSGNVPRDSNDYEGWFEHISISAGYCLEVDDEWVKVQFMHLETPIWFHHSKLECCK